MVFLAAMENMTMTLKTMLTAQHTHVSQYSGGEIKGTSLRQLPASGISLSKQTRRWRHGQHLRHHSADWKQVALWLIRKIDIVPHSSEKHAKMWSSFIFPLMICSETQRKQWSAHSQADRQIPRLPAFHLKSSLGFWGQTKDLMQSTEKFSSPGIFQTECFEINFTPPQKECETNEYVIRLSGMNREELTFSFRNFCFLLSATFFHVKP